MQRILVCLDRSQTSEVCLPHAVMLARSFGGRLQLVSVLEQSTCGSASEPPDALRQQIERAKAGEYLDEVAQRISALGVPVDTTVLQGHAAEQLLCFADREHVDLIVLSTHGEKGLTGWKLASTTHKILARALASLLVVPATTQPPRELDSAVLRTILAPLDGSPRAESVLPMLERLAGSSDIHLVLLHALPPLEWLPLEPPTPEDTELASRLRTRNEEAARAYLARVAARLVHEGCRVKQLVESGDLRSVLPQVVKSENVDLIALTAHGRSGDLSRSCGDRAGSILCRSETPILMLQNLAHPRAEFAEFAEAVRHCREAVPLRGSDRPEQP